MSGAGLWIVVAGVLLIGASLAGLFNRGRSVACAVAGGLVALGAGLGVWHAWAEAGSPAWTTGYLVLALVGLVAVFRQVKRRKP